MDQITRWAIAAKENLRLLFEEGIRKVWNSPWVGISLWLLATGWVVYCIR
jgi:hypothetical protein